MSAIGTQHGYVAESRDLRESLTMACYLAMTDRHSEMNRDMRRASWILHGLPVGGQPDTEQAIRDLIGMLPPLADRQYTHLEFIAAMYRIEKVDERSAGIYRRRT